MLTARQEIGDPPSEEEGLKRSHSASSSPASPAEKADDKGVLLGLRGGLAEENGPAIAG
jgi:hypothetical protein